MTERRSTFDVQNSADQPRESIPGEIALKSRRTLSNDESGHEASLNRVGARIDAAKIQMDSLGRSLAVMMLQQSHARETPAFPAIMNGSSPLSPMTSTIGDMPSLSASGQVIATQHDPLNELATPEPRLAPDLAGEVDHEADSGEFSGELPSGGLQVQASSNPLGGRLGEGSLAIDSAPSMTVMTDLTARVFGGDADLSAEGRRPFPWDGNPSSAVRGMSPPTLSDGHTAWAGGLSFLGRLVSLESERALADRTEAPGDVPFPANLATLETAGGPASEEGEPQGQGLDSMLHRTVGNAFPGKTPWASVDVLDRREPLSPVSGASPLGIFDLGDGGPGSGAIDSAMSLGDNLQDDFSVGTADSQSRPFSARGMDTSARGDSPIDLSRTNQLLQQLIEEVRKGRPGFSSGGTRQVEPAR